MIKLFTCKDCKQPKTHEEMNADKRLKHGITGQCKACRSEQRYLNGDYMRERIRKYGYRKAGGGVPRISFEEMQSFMQKKTCSYCGIVLTLGNGDATEQCADHVYPISDVLGGYGGENLAGNVAVCCRGCNASKGNDHIHEFYLRSDKFTSELWTEFVHDFGSRLLERDLSHDEVEQLKRDFAEEAAELRANLTAKKGLPDD